ncbi:MAG: L-aspartate oxidase, partial [Thermoproteota archaeon]
MNKNTSDVLIIGCGIAGLSSAIKLAESGLKITIVTKQKNPNETNTYWAQGGIIYSQKDSKDYESLISDIDKASSHSANIKAASVLAERSTKIVEELLLEKADTNFERDEEGNLLFTKEAAHSVKRILYNGDMTGKEIQTSLLNFLNDKSRFPNVEIKSSTTAIDLITANHHGLTIHQRYEEHKILGAYLYDQIQDQVIKYVSKVTILATGGIGALYLNHSNSEAARGDGLAMAKRSGAILSNMEFVQFHPTTFYDSSTHRRFLVSEALRGEGGILVNSRGERFMHEYHQDLELAPRDVVARAINDQMLKTKHDCVYLDITAKDPEWLRKRFPAINKHCMERRVDFTKEAIPVVPAAHYSCGGIKTDLHGRTSIQNLYAIGEVACTGLHGANRLASTSLLEGLTWGYIAAEDIKTKVSEIEIYDAIKIKDWSL